MPKINSGKMQRDMAVAGNTHRVDLFDLFAVTLAGNIFERHLRE